MLTEVKAYSSWVSAPQLLLSETGRPETDLIQIRNIDGLDPVKASVNTSPFGSVDGAAYVGGSVENRNIVLTVHPNPDWNVWSYEAIRRLLYSYFMPKRLSKLAFYSDDLPPVEIAGIVETVQINQFSKDPEFQVSIICPDPYFTSIEPKVITGQAVRPDGDPIIVSYEGNIEAGIYVKASWVSDPAPNTIEILMGDPEISHISLNVGALNSDWYFELSSIPMQKYVQSISIGDGIISNQLSHVQEGSSWPLLQPGDNEFFVITDQGVQDWELTYYERFGGL